MAQTVKRIRTYTQYDVYAMNNSCILTNGTNMCVTLILVNSLRLITT